MKKGMRGKFWTAFFLLFISLSDAQGQLRILAEPNEKNQAVHVVEPGTLISNIKQMHDLKLLKRVLDLPPWTDSYWPLYKGMIGIRYSDPKFPNSNQWSTNYQYVVSHPASSVALLGGEAVDALSPAEKYDLAVGDSTFSLTRYVWQTGQKYSEETGSVAKWMGICHGWAGAAHMNVPLRTDPVQVVSAAGLVITFHPQDIKALQSLLWARGYAETKFIGERCNTSNPDRSSHGRVVDEKCFDLNPGTWHQVVVTQLGQNQRSFVMDATFDAQVWNYPLAGYQYQYFNLKTYQTSQKINEALMPVEQFRTDRFKDFRNPKTKFILGILMEVSHVKATMPSRSKPIDPPPLKQLKFLYDLELDEQLNIIGGEWYSKVHPDFVWTFAKGTQAVGPGDQALLSDAWTLERPVPAHWVEAAQRSSARGIPLYSFIKGLTEIPTPPSLP